MLIFLLLVFLLFGIHSLIKTSTRLDGMLTYPLAFALLLAMVSYCYYLSLVSGIGYEWVFAALSGLLCFQLFRAGKAILSLKQQDFRDILWLLVFALTITMLFRARIHRWGDWDAWAIWNLHAKFLADADRWRQMFTSKMAPTHPDYPLMLPSVVAFFWRASGIISPVVPMLVSNLVYVAVPITAFLALRRNGYLLMAVVSAVVFVSDHKFKELAASQYADTLLALFILIAFIVYREANSVGRLPAFVLLGLFVGSSSWIKNEGLLFFAVFSVTFLFFHRKEPARIGLFLVGAALPLCVLLHFKLTLAPPNDLIHEGRSGSMLSLLLQPSRYLLIAGQSFRMLVTEYWILLVLMGGLLVRRARWTNTLPFWVLTLLLTGYFAVYLTTPHDLDWHVRNSVDRLLHHVYPAAVYLLLMRWAGPGTIQPSPVEPAKGDLVKISQ